MTQTQDQALSKIGFDPCSLATPMLMLLRAELLALERMLPGQDSTITAADEAQIEAQMDNMPV